MSKSKSPAMCLVHCAWADACSGRTFSWDAFNSAVGKIVRIAAASFRWDDGDISELNEIANCRYSIWRCIGDGELLYAIACTAGNDSFCRAWEKHHGRAPVFGDEVQPACGSDQACVHVVSRVARGRLHFGAEFRYGDNRLRVTSFNKDGSVNCQRYERRGGCDVVVEKFLRGKAITRKMIAEDRKARKAVSA